VIIKANQPTSLAASIGLEAVLQIDPSKHPPRHKGPRRHRIPRGRPRQEGHEPGNDHRETPPGGARSVLVVYIPSTHQAGGVSHWLEAIRIAAGEAAVAGETRRGPVRPVSE
jgi:hypothetical protein